MKTLYLDCFSGISGDMFLGLLLDLGLDQARLEAELGKLRLPGWGLQVGREERHGIEGTRVKVVCAEDHHHRHWRDIDRLLVSCSLDLNIKERARRIFRRLGEAEAKVHGIRLEDVHFHEVGALDAIVDLVGAAVGLERLGIGQVICSPLPLSRGMTQCAHGMLPLPAPAVVELLQGAPITDSGCDKELVTPSGAAIACEAVHFGPLPAMRVAKSGYGVGGWKLSDRPNLLRGLLGEATSPLQRDRVMVLESHIDDANPEWLGALLEDLMAAGALDATYAPLQMKKNRPGTRLTVITAEADAESLARLILTGSSASGVRSYPAERYKLERRMIEVETELGPAAAKLFYDGERLLRIAPEYETCRSLSRETGVPLPEVYRLVETAARSQAGDSSRTKNTKNKK